MQLGDKHVESNTVGKILVAFLAGALFALGGAIFYSRQAVMLDPVHASEVAPATVQTGSVPSEPAKPVAAPEAQVQQSKPLAAEPAEIKPAVPVKARKSVPGSRPPKPQVPVQEARLQAPTVLPATPVVNQDNPVVPPPNSVVERQDPPAPQQQPHVVTLPAGTNLTVRVRESLSSDRNGPGDAFQGSLEAPVIADGFIIAERQSRVVGRVTEANPAGRVKGLSNLTIALSELNTTDGQRISIETDSYGKWGNSSVKGDAAKVAGAAALGAIIGAIAGGGKGAAIGAGAGGAAGTGVALGTRGASASIPSESTVTFRLARPVTITEKFN
jgi:hypothetical protein